MMPTPRLMQFDDFVEINPRVSLQKGNDYPFVAMDIVTPEHRYVRSQNVREFKGGGAKFQNQDTLFARITPCLENGKIAQATDLLGGIGFGSTEFFVFRSKPGISDHAYIYYLASTPIIRGAAEKSMSGTSGRQRADLSQLGRGPHRCAADGHGGRRDRDGTDPDGDAAAGELDTADGQRR